MAPRGPDYGEATPEDLARALLNAPPEESEWRVPKHSPRASMPDRTDVVDDGANVPVEVNEVGADPTAQEPRVESPNQE